MTEPPPLAHVATDAELVEHLWVEIHSNDQELYKILDDLSLTIEQTRQRGENDVFAYGKLLSYLQTDPDMNEVAKTRLLAAAIWELSKDKNDHD